MLNFIMRSIIRRPIKNLIFMLLFIGLTAFGTLELALSIMTNAVSDEIRNNYPMVGSLVAKNTNEIMERAFSGEGVAQIYKEEYEKISGSNYILNTDYRKALAAHIDGLNRLKEETKVHTFAKGRILSISEPEEKFKTISMQIKLEVTDIVSAPLEKYEVGNQLNITVVSESSQAEINQLKMLYKTLVIGEEYYFRLNYDNETILKITGETYFSLDNPLTSSEKLFFSASDSAEVDKYMEQYAMEMKIDKLSQQLFDAVFTSDIMMIPYFNNRNIVLTNGRVFKEEEYQMDSKVCMISKTLAERYHLSVGDTLKIGFSVNYGISRNGYTARPNVPIDTGELPQPTDSLEYTIVGIYANHAYNAYDSNSFSDSTLFFPISSLIVPEGTDIFASMLFTFAVSFQFSDWSAAEGFIKEMKQFKIMDNFNLVCEDNNFQEILPILNEMKKDSIRMMAVAFIAGLLLLSLLLYFFIMRKKREYAIMRFMGTPLKKVNISYLAELSVPVIIGSMIGCIIGRVSFERFFHKVSDIVIGNSGVLKTEQFIEALKQLESNSSSVWNASFLLFAVILILLYTAAFICLKKIANKPVLSLMSDIKKN